MLITSLGAYFEYVGFIPHHNILVWSDYTLYKEPVYLIVFFGTFATLLYVSIYLTNSIARELYTRERDLTSALKKLEEAERMGTPEEIETLRKQLEDAEKTAETAGGFRSYLRIQACPSGIA